ncbi:hypothetical protein [Bradyrhizobium sp. Cp5.3]|uniref:hypothetical protein n=1 Tax=Bradyrhizobium sp. Cp5.3 TaxID=443598 RepID=UPI00040E7D3C|nr:hypothetical protein [Bradyrhizobium sp. Cp5.3]
MPALSSDIPLLNIRPSAERYIAGYDIAIFRNVAAQGSCESVLSIDETSATQQAPCPAAKPVRRLAHGFFR